MRKLEDGFYINYQKISGALMPRLGYLIIWRYSLTLPSPSETSLGL